MALPLCADCGGFDIEWMRRCSKHGLEYCRGCSCPGCDEEAWDEYEDDGPLDLEDQLENALERALPVNGEAPRG
jgi:hypothetical protein